MAIFMFNEGYTLNKPPMIIDHRFEHWKIRMKIYLQSIDIDLWKIISNKFISKQRSQWKEEDKHNFHLNARTMKILYCAIDESYFDKIISCSSANELWLALEQMHSNQTYELYLVDEVGENH